MNNYFKRFLLVIFSFIFLFLSACSTPQNNNEEDDNKNETTEEINEKNPYFDMIKDLPDKDFKNKKFRIATDSAQHIFSSNTNSVIGKEYFLRNAAVEKKYNVKLTLTDESGLPTVGDRIKTEALAGTDYCDLIILQDKTFQILAANDSLMNVRSVPYLNLNASYFFQNALESTTLGNYSYGFSGDFIYDPEDCFAVFFNKKLLSKAQLPDIYQLVRDNQWDMDNFLIFAEEIYSLVRSEGQKMSGITSEHTTEDLINVFWAATGFRYFANDYGTRPELIFDHEYTQNFITSQKNIFFKTSAYSSDTETALDTFRNGESFFFIAPLSAADDVTGFGINWGLVPVPKLDINQTAHYTYLNNGFQYAGFAKGTKDPTFSGMITSALFAASEGLNQKIKVQSFLNLYLNSETDVEMMEKIISSPYYDAASFFETTSSSFPAATKTLLYRVISADGDFNSLFDQYSILLNSFLDSKI